MYVIFQGVYVYSQTSRTGRRLINIVDMSHTVSDSVQQIIRGPDQYNQILWQKVSEGTIMFCFVHTSSCRWCGLVTLTYPCPLELASLCEEAEGGSLTCLWLVQTHRGPLINVAW